MTQPIGIGSANGVSLNGIGGVGNRPSDLAAAAMTTLSARIAGTITRELGLGGSGTRSLSGDLYGVEGVAQDLAGALNASPTDAGRLSRALNEFTSEVAALLAAKPHSSVLGMVSGLHFNLVDSDGRPGSTDADYACSAVQAAVFRLREDAPWTSAP
jgi:hypothetical protein